MRQDFFVDEFFGQIRRSVHGRRHLESKLACSEIDRVALLFQSPLSSDSMGDRGKKRPAEQQLEPDITRSERSILPLRQSMIKDELIALSMAENVETARHKVRVAEARLEEANQATVKLTKRLLASEGQAKVAQAAQKATEGTLASLTLKLRQAHSRAALAMNRESALRKELDAKELEIATATECSVCYSQANVPGHEPYRLGCSEGHVLCYECIYMVYLQPQKPSRECPHCRGPLKRAPYCDRILLSLVQQALPAHTPSGNDIRLSAPANRAWLQRMKWPPCLSDAREIRRWIKEQESQALREAVKEDSGSD